jgi:hypothetical protein
MKMKFIVTGALSIIAWAVVAAPAIATDYRGARCKNCPQPRTYDSQEVIQTTRDVDRSRVIETQSVVPVSRQYKTTNHLVIRKNLIRNVGVIRHKHTIIEKEIRYRRPVVYVRRGPVVVNFVSQKYRAVHRPAVYAEPILYRRAAPAQRYRMPLRVRG